MFVSVQALDTVTRKKLGEKKLRGETIITKSRTLKTSSDSVSQGVQKSTKCTR